MKFARRSLLLVCLVLLLGGVAARAATAPAGFQLLTVATGIASPSGLAFAPDGRLFVLEKASGRVRIVKNGALLATPFLDLATFIVPPMYLDNFFERGLLGITFDPGFATNRFVYLYYTLCKAPGSGSCNTAVNRVARFVANGDVVVPGSQTVILDDIPNDAGNHNAGWIEFGPDGKLYVSVGDGGAASGTAVDLNGLNGKILRINADGTIPANNPFAGQANRRGEIWAYGLRNPWRCRFQPTSERLFCADVGQNTWEELDIIEPGLNYGWPTTEGPFNPATWPQFEHPIYWYGHAGRASISGGDFGTRTNFPGDHQQSYYFGDYALGWIKRAILDAAGTTVLSVVDFVTAIGTNTVTEVVAGPDGDLYYTDFVAGAVRKVELVTTNRSPIAAASADPAKGAAPLTVQFSSAGSSDPDGNPITYSWDFGDGSPLSTQPNPQHVYETEGPYTATLTVSDGQAVPGPTSDSVEIDVGDPPVVTITAPVDLAIYHAGDTVPLAGFAIDAEDGVLPPSALHWKIVFHHDDHTHPFIEDIVGSPKSFVWATAGEPDPDVGYEIILSATDSSGLTTTETVFVIPALGSYTLVTDPPGLQLLLDGQSVSTPLAVTGVIGYPRTLDAPSPQAGNGLTWVFSQWSDGGAKQHAILPQTTARTYTARYVNACTAPTVIPAAGGVFTGTTSGDSTLSGTCAKTDTTAERVYAWTPAVSGTATIQTCGGSTAYDTVLYLRSGSCSSGTQVACNDDTTGCSSTSGANHGSRLTPTVTAGQTYYIVVDGFDGREGTYSLSVTPPAGSPTTTTTAPPTTTTASPTTSTSTTSTTSTTATSSTTTTVTTTTSSTAVTPTTSTTTSTSTSTSTVAGSGTCANPLVVPAGGGTLTGTTSGTSALAAGCTTSGNSPEKVFRWTPTVSGVATIRTCGTGTHYDTVLYVRDGTCGGSQLACNDDTTGCATASGPNHGSRLTLAVTAGQTYFIVVDGYNGRSGNFALIVTPPDGTCTNQFVVPPAGGIFTGTTAGTSQQTGTCGASDKAPDHVYAWTPSTSGPATISTCGTVTTYDTVLYLRNDTCTGSEAGCNDDTPTCGTATGPAHGSRLTPTVTAGETYYIVVDGYNGAKGTYRLAVTAPGNPTTTTTVTTTSTSSSSTTTSTLITTTTSAPPIPTTTSTSSTTSTTATIPPGTCGSPIVIPAAGGTVAGTTTGTGAQSGTCADTDTSGERVYAWTPAVSGSVTIQTCSPSTAFDTVLYVRGGACGTGTQLGCNDDTIGCGTGDGTPNAARHGSRVTLSVVAGTTYHIFVDGFGGKTGAYQLTVTPGAPPTTTTTLAVGTTSTTVVVTTSTTIPTTSTTTSTSSTSTSTTSTTLPPGSCGNPVAIAAAGGTVSGTTSGAGSQAGSCGQSGTAGERVYRWTPADSGVATIQTCSTGTAYDTVLYVRSSACSAGTEAACSDDTTGCGTASGPNHGSRITLAVTAGQTYYLVVDGYTGKTGAFNLTVFPPNGTCANPFTLPAGGGAVSRTTTGGSQEAGSCAASGSAPEVVYRWIPGKSGAARLETCGTGTNYDTVLYLRSSTCDSGPEVACNDDTCPVAVNDHWGSRITPTVTAGQTYYVVVDGYNGRSGTFRLNVIPPP